MEVRVTKCKNRHYYDANKHPVCPHCGSASILEGSETEQPEKKKGIQLFKKKKAAAAKKKAEAEAAAKKAAEKEAKAKKEEARKVAIAAAASYYALVYPEFSGEDLDTFAKTAIDSVAKSIELVKKLESGQCTSIFDIFE
jgi:predicted  nucleic acid-binding Zn-ribbon protein